MYHNNHNDIYDDNNINNDNNYNKNQFDLSLSNDKSDDWLIRKKKGSVNIRTLGRLKSH